VIKTLSDCLFLLVQRKKEEAEDSIVCREGIQDGGFSGLCYLDGAAVPSVVKLAVSRELDKTGGGATTVDTAARGWMIGDR
jgi:hypothetical protein